MVGGQRDQACRADRAQTGPAPRGEGEAEPLGAGQRAGPVRHRRAAPPGAGGLGGVARAVPRGRQRRGGLRARRLPGPRRGRAGPERGRRGGPRRGARPAAADAAGRHARGRQHRGPAGRGRGRGAVHAASLQQARPGPGDRAADDPGAAGGAPGPVGRFGVGFAAAVAVSDEPAIRSVTGAVGWSRQAARDLVRQTPELAGELAARAGHVPVLRLPFAADGAPPDGFATAVVLPLRDEAAAGADQAAAGRGRPGAAAGPARAGHHRHRGGRRHAGADRGPRRRRRDDHRGRRGGPVAHRRRGRPPPARSCWPTGRPRNGAPGLVGALGRPGRLVRRGPGRRGQDGDVRPGSCRTGSAR